MLFFSRTIYCYILIFWDHHVQIFDEVVVGLGPSLHTNLCNSPSTQKKIIFIVRSTIVSKTSVNPRTCDRMRFFRRDGTPIESIRKSHNGTPHHRFRDFRNGDISHGGIIESVKFAITITARRGNWRAFFSPRRTADSVRKLHQR